MPKIYKQICKNCNRYYKGHGKYFCSIDCSTKKGSNHYKWKGGNIKVFCNNCDKIFYKKRDQVTKNNFCSLKCFGKLLSKNNLGENNHNWRGGIKCIDCKSSINTYGAKRCFQCFRKWQQQNIVQGENHYAWQGGKPKCLDCKKLLSSYSAKYCRRHMLNGEKSPVWKGGISTINNLIRTSLEYKQWRKKVFERDSYICQWCGIHTGLGKKVILNVDHIVPFSWIIKKNKIKTLDKAINCEELWDIRNGRTLCKSCHKQTETYGINAQYWGIKNGLELERVENME